MLHNLLAEMAKKNIKKKDIAQALDIDNKTLWNKLNGVTQFKATELLAVRDTYFPDCDIEYLFKTEKE